MLLRLLLNVILLVCFAGAGWGAGQTPRRQAESSPPGGTPAAPTYRIRVWVLRPVSTASPTNAEFSRNPGKWNVIRVPEKLTERALDSGDLSALARANPTFRFGKVLDTRTASFVGDENWSFSFGTTTWLTLSVITPTPPPLPGAKPGDLPCRVEASFEPPANTRVSGLPPRVSGSVDGSYRIYGRFEISPGRIVAFNAGQAFTLAPAASPKSARRWVHTPRDLVLLAIRPEPKQRRNDR
jgi:hypothetical protein